MGKDILDKPNLKSGPPWQASSENVGQCPLPRPEKGKDHRKGCYRIKREKRRDLRTTGTLQGRPSSLLRNPTRRGRPGFSLGVSEEHIKLTNKPNSCKLWQRKC